LLMSKSQSQKTLPIPIRWPHFANFLIIRETAQRLYHSKCESKSKFSDLQAIWSIDDSRSPIAISWNFQRCDEPFCPFRV
jgi:hypothetical protein